MTGKPLWLPGFFTGRRHAVVDLTPAMDFHGQSIGWSVCDRPVLLRSDLALASVRGTECPRCAPWLWPVS